MKLMSLALGLAAVASSAAAPATVTLLTSPVQVAATYTNNFETVVNSGPVTWNSSAALMTSSQASGGVTTSETMGLVAAETASLSSLFTAVGFSFGNDDLCCTSNFNAVLSVYNDAIFLGSVSVAANMNDFVDQFIGLSSTNAFNRVTLVYQGGGSLTEFIDDFQLGGPVAASVPEPSAWAMMLLGFGAIGFALRTRQRKTLQLA